MYWKKTYFTIWEEGKISYDSKFRAIRKRIDKFSNIKKKQNLHLHGKVYFM